MLRLLGVPEELVAAGVLGILLAAQEVQELPARLVVAAAAAGHQDRSMELEVLEALVRRARLLPEAVVADGRGVWAVLLLGIRRALVERYFLQRPAALVALL